MKSIRSWLFGVFPLIAISTLIGMDVRMVAVPSLDWRDLCVHGRGYIETVDDNGENPVWHRCIKLCINQNGLLCANVDGIMRPIEPQISVPSDWTYIDIDDKGTVLIGNSVYSGQTIGTIGISTFFGDDLSQSTRVSASQEQMGYSSKVLPGNNGAGYLMQRTAFQYCIPLTYRTSLGFVFFAFWLGLVALIRTRSVNEGLVAPHSRFGL